jgi:tRNA-specific 2-thiouridylase
MSGGVDSSVAAALLVAEGLEVVGVTMHLAGDASRCCSLEDADDARRVAEKLGVRFYVANYSERFRSEVVEAFADAYLAGRTPIPCVTCNSRFKFEYLMSRADAFEATQVATGHYARISRDPDSGRRRLFRARYRPKDQSYFLFELSQEQLRRVSFPLGEMSKQEVRSAARELGLATAEKAESQEICFVPDGDYASVVETIRPQAKALRGEFVDAQGHVLGTHRGIHHYTVGQRRGLGIEESNRPLYVSRIDPETGRIVVGGREELEVMGAVLGRVNWIAGEAPTQKQRVRVQIRHRHEGAVAWVEAGADGAALVHFDEPVEAVTPGQAAVFYDAEDDEEVLGGGWIEGAIP